MNIPYDEKMSPIKCQILKRKSDNKLFVEIPSEALDSQLHPTPIDSNKSHLYCTILRDNGSCTAILFEEYDESTNTSIKENTENTKLISFSTDNYNPEPLTPEDLNKIEQDEMEIIAMIESFPTEPNQVIQMLKNMVREKLGDNKYYTYRDTILEQKFKDGLVLHGIVKSNEDLPNYIQQYTVEFSKVGKKQINNIIDYGKMSYVEIEAMIENEFHLSKSEIKNRVEKEIDNLSGLIDIDAGIIILIKKLKNLIPLLPKEQQQTKPIKKPILSKEEKPKPPSPIKDIPPKQQSNTNTNNKHTKILQSISEFKLTGLKKALIMYMITNAGVNGIPIEKFYASFKKFNSGAVITPEMINTELISLEQNYGLITKTENIYNLIE